MEHSGFQVTGVIKWGQQSKPKKILRVSTITLDQKLTPKVTPSEYSDCIEYPKNPYLNQATPKEYLPNFSIPKNPGIENFKPKKIIQSSPPLEIRSPPTPRAAKYRF